MLFPSSDKASREGAVVLQSHLTSSLEDLTENEREPCVLLNWELSLLGDRGSQLLGCITQTHYLPAHLISRYVSRLRSLTCCDIRKPDDISLQDFKIMWSLKILSAVDVALTEECSLKIEQPLMESLKNLSVDKFTQMTLSGESPNYPRESNKVNVTIL